MPLQLAVAIPLAATSTASGIAVFMEQLSVPLVVAQTAGLHNGGTVDDVIRCTFLQQRWMWPVDGHCFAAWLARAHAAPRRHGADSVDDCSVRLAATGSV